jgi:hypothetical protein
LVRLKKSFGGEEVDHDGGVVSGEDRWVGTIDI